MTTIARHPLYNQARPIRMAQNSKPMQIPIAVIVSKRLQALRPGIQLESEIARRQAV